MNQLTAADYPWFHNCKLCLIWPPVTTQPNAALENNSVQIRDSWFHLSEEVRSLSTGLQERQTDRAQIPLKPTWNNQAWQQQLSTDTTPLSKKNTQDIPLYAYASQNHDIKLCVNISRQARRIKENKLLPSLNMFIRNGLLIFWWTTTECNDFVSFLQYSLVVRVVLPGLVPLCLFRD